MKRTRNVSVTVSMDQASQDLQVTRRTLLASLCVLATWFRTEAARSAAGRAGREFLNPAHIRNPQLKFYSIVGPKNDRPGVSFVLRRNYPLIAQMQSSTGIASFALSPVSPFGKNDGTGKTALTALISAEKKTLADYLLRASVLSGDRRTDRWERRKLAKKNGLSSS